MISAITDFIRRSSISRGYFQKSIAVVSPLPFVGLFTQVRRRLGPRLSLPPLPTLCPCTCWCQQVARILGRMYFDAGESALEAACQNIAAWPDPLACMGATVTCVVCVPRVVLTDTMLV